MCRSDHTATYWDFVAWLSSSGGGAGVAEAEPVRHAAAGGVSSYLESSVKDCDRGKREKENPFSEPQFELCAVGCRSWFCPNCCTGRGLALRKRLLAVLATFKGLTTWTFTIDPTLFPSPEAAYLYVREKRCIAVLMRTLKNKKLLHSGRFFYVVEWQEKTKMAHFHVLMDASFIEFDTVKEIWNSFRPDEAGPVQGDRPAFGSIRFTKGDFRDHRHAAYYACAYLIKFPKEGYPDWVLDMTACSGKRQVHRYSTSRGFWPKVDAQEDLHEQDDITAEEEIEYAESEEDPDEELPEDTDGESEVIEKDEPKTIRQRLERCGKKSVVLQLTECVDPGTGEVVIRRDFVAQVEAPFAEVVAELGIDTQGKRRTLITIEQLYHKIGAKHINRLRVQDTVKEYRRLDC